MAPRIVDVLPDDRPPGTFDPNRLLVELGTFREPWRLAARAPALAFAPRGDGRVTFDLPGFRAPEASMAPIRGFLRSRNHRARSWGLGTNEGDVHGSVRAMIDTAERAVDETGRTVNLVGWSLGGVVARELARFRPDLVHRVVTFGSPVVGGPRYTTTPTTIIYSRNDGIVDWRNCIDRSAGNATHVEVDSTHLGLGLDPDVWVATARALAAD